MVPGDVQSWVQDIVNLNLGSRHVRVPLNTPRPTTPPPYSGDYGAFRDFIVGCANRGLIPLAVLTSGIAGVDMASVQPRATLVGSPPSNAYIDAYSTEAGRIAQDLAGIVNHFELWNEPNDVPITEDNFIWRSNFAALLVNTSAAIRSINPLARIVSGGLLFSDAVDAMPWLTAPASDPDGAGIFTWLDSQGVSPYPWDYLGVHTYFMGLPNPSGQETISTGKCPTGPNDTRRRRPSDMVNGIWRSA